MKLKPSHLRESDLAEKYKGPGNCTTVMIRNIPTEYTQDELIQEVCESLEASNLFDFFYLPWDTQNSGNVGYCFVNFLDPGTAQRAVRQFTNYRFKLHESRKVAKVSPAHIQGLENNLRHLQDRAVVHGNHPCGPVVFWHGQKVELSKVFEKLKAQDQGRGGGIQAPRSAPGRSGPHPAPLAALPAAPPHSLVNPNQALAGLQAACPAAGLGFPSPLVGFDSAAAASELLLDDAARMLLNPATAGALLQGSLGLRAAPLSSPLGWGSVGVSGVGGVGVDTSFADMLDWITMNSSGLENTGNPGGIALSNVFEDESPVGPTWQHRNQELLQPLQPTMPSLSQQGAPLLGAALSAQMVSPGSTGSRSGRFSTSPKAPLSSGGFNPFQDHDVSPVHSGLPLLSPPHSLAAGPPGLANSSGSSLLSVPAACHFESGAGNSPSGRLAAPGSCGGSSRRGGVSPVSPVSVPSPLSATSTSGSMIEPTEAGLIEICVTNPHQDVFEKFIGKFGS